MNEDGMNQRYDETSPAGGFLIQHSSKFHIRPEHIAGAVMLISLALLVGLVLWIR